MQFYRVFCPIIVQGILTNVTVRTHLYRYYEQRGADLRFRAGYPGNWLFVARRDSTYSWCSRTRLVRSLAKIPRCLDWHLDSLRRSVPSTQVYAKDYHPPNLCSYLGRKRIDPLQDHLAECRQEAADTAFAQQRDQEYNGNEVRPFGRSSSMQR